MRILHLIHQYPPEFIGGTEMYTQTLARAQVDQGHQVAVFYPSPQVAGASQPEVKTEEGLRVYKAPLGSGEPVSRHRVFLNTFHAPHLVAMFRQVLAEEQPDLVHIQHLMGLPVSLVSQIQAAAIPYVVTLHDYWFPCANAQLLTNFDQTICAGPHWWVNCGRCALARSGRDNRLFAPVLAPLFATRSRLLRPVLKNASATIAPTHFVQQTYAQMGMTATRITVVPHGIHLPPELPRNERKSRPDPLHIAYVGGIAFQKGVHILVDALNGLPEDGFTLTIYGDLTNQPDYVDEIQALATHPGIRFAGRVGREDMWAGLAAADVLAVPSLWYETAVLVIQEGYAAGIPVLASDLGAMRERVRHEVDGLLLPPGDVGAWREAFLRLREEPRLWSNLQAGIQPVRGIVEHIQDIMSVYGRVLARTPQDSMPRAG